MYCRELGNAQGILAKKTSITDRIKAPSSEIVLVKDTRKEIKRLNTSLSLDQTITPTDRITEARCLLFSRPLLGEDGFCSVPSQVNKLQSIQAFFNVLKVFKDLPNAEVEVGLIIMAYLLETDVAVVRVSKEIDFLSRKSQPSCAGYHEEFLRLAARPL